MIASRILKYPQIETFPKGFLWPSKEEDFVITDEGSSEIANLAASQDVSYLRFEILDSKSEEEASYKGDLSNASLKVLKQCKFEISGVEHETVEEQNVESALARLRLEATRQNTVDEENDGKLAASVLLEDPEILEKRLKSDFVDLSDAFHAEVENGLRLPVDELYQLLLKFGSLANISSIASYDDLVELCQTLYRKYLGNPEQSSLVDDINNGSLQIITERLKVVNILILFLSALLKHSDDALLAEDVLLASLSFLLSLSEVFSTQERASQLSEPILESFHELSYEFTKSITLLSTNILNPSLPESIVNKLDLLALRVLSNEFRLNSQEEYTLIEDGVTILTELYDCFPSQRKFLLQEVLNNSCSMVSRRRYVQGIELMPLSTLLIVFLSCMGSSKFEASDIKAEASAKQNYLLKNVRNSSHNSLLVSSQIAEYLVGKACIDSKTEGNLWLKVLQNLLDDLVKLSDVPDMISSELMLYTLIWKLIDASEADIGRGTALDLAAHVGKCLSPPLKLGSPFVEFVNFTESQFKDYVRGALSVAAYLKKCRSTTYKYFVTSFIKDLDVMSTSELDEEGMDTESTLASHLARQVLSTIMLSGYDYSWYSLELKLPQSSSNEPRSLEILVSDDIENSMSNYQKLRPIARCYDLILRNLLHQLKSAKVARKSKALKCIASLMETNTDIFALKQVQEALSECVIHNSILVREAAIEIIGKFVLAEKSLSLTMYDLLCIRVNDSGVAVRKKIINILKNGLVSTITYGTPMWHKTIHCFFQRLEDIEPSIVTEVMGLLSTQLFKCLEPSEIGEEEYDTLSPQFSYWVKTMLDLKKRNPELTKKFFRKCLRSPNGEDPTLALVDRKRFQAQCKAICGYAVSSLDEAEFFETPLAPYMAISFLVSCDGSLLKQDDVDLLSVYLTPLEVSNASCALVLTSVKDSVTDLRNVFSTSMLEELEVIILENLSEYDITEQDSAVKLLAAICTRLKSHTTIANVLSKCFDAFGSENELGYTKKLVKLIRLTSNLARYCDEETSQHIYSRGKALKTGVRHYTVGKLMKYTKQEADPRICSLAIRSIGEICTGDPQLFFQKDVLELFDHVMDPSHLQNKNSSDSSDKISVMSFLLDMLLEEGENEKRPHRLDLKKDQRQKKRRKVSHPNAETWVSGVDIKDLKGVSESSIKDGAYVGLVQRYLDEIRRIALLPPNKNNRPSVLIAVKLIEQICIQGLAHPKSFVTAIVALGVSPQAQVRGLAKSAYTVMMSKYKSVLENLYVESLKVMFEYESSLGPERGGRTNSLDELYFVVRDTKTSRTKFIANVIKALEFEAFRCSLEDIRQQFDFAVYISKALSCLPFGTYGEVLSILRGVESFIMTEGSELWSRIEEDDEELPDTILGMSCGVMVVLWRLRMFLKDYYDISDSRIRQKDTSSATRNTKTGACVTATGSLDLSDLTNKIGVNEDLKRIALFREVMEDGLNINDVAEDSDEEFD